MNWLFVRRRITSSLAALALLWAALVPSIGMAFIQGGGEKGTLLAVCSGNGLRYVKAEVPTSAAAVPDDNVPVQTSMALECPFCQFNLHLGMLPESAPATLHPVRVPVIVFNAPPASPVAQFPWRRPPAHAPPL